MNSPEATVLEPPPRPSFRMWICLWIGTCISGVVGIAAARWLSSGPELTLQDALRIGAAAAIGSLFGGVSAGQVSGLLWGGISSACAAAKDESWGIAIIFSILMGLMMGTLMRIVLWFYKFNTTYRQNNK